MFLSFPAMAWSAYGSNDHRHYLSQYVENFKISLKHRRKHVLRSLPETRLKFHVEPISDPSSDCNDKNAMKLENYKKVVVTMVT